MEVVPHWTPLFRLHGRLFLLLASKAGQLALPTRTEAVDSRLFAIAGDGREGTRAWVRTNRGDGRAGRQHEQNSQIRAHGEGIPLTTL